MSKPISIVLIIVVLFAIAFLGYQFVFNSDPEITGHAVAVKEAPQEEKTTEIFCDYPYTKYKGPYPEYQGDCCMDKNANEICDEEEPEVFMNKSGEIEEEQYKNLIIYNYTKGRTQATLIHFAKLDNELLIGESPIIFLKNANDEGYQELKKYLDEEGVNMLLILKEDVEIGQKLREYTRVNMMVKFGKSARAPEEGIFT